jgi:CRP/FNR family transcriptional regulator, dissimilatory nitrate respiration regulator
MSLQHRRVQVSPEALLARQPLFRGLDKSTIGRLAAAATRKLLARGEFLFVQGTRPTGMYVVVYGRIKLLSNRGTKAERLTGIAGPGRSFGEPVMFLDAPALVDAIAIEDALVLHLPKAAVDGELERNPAFVRGMLANLSQRVEGLVHELASHSNSTGRDRLLQYLLRQAEPSDGGPTVNLGVSKAQLASRLHLTAEHFSRLLHELAREGRIRVQGREIVILEPASLATQAQAHGNAEPPPAASGAPTA